MNLRALAKEYANGVLGQQAYRKARDELLESILAGTTKVTAHDFLPPLSVQKKHDAMTEYKRSPRESSPSRKEEPEPELTASDIEEMKKQGMAPSGHRGILLGLVVVITFLVVAVFFYPFTQPTSPESAGAFPHPAPQNSSSAVAGVKLIKQFLQQADWTDASMQQFVNHWENLSTEEKDAGLSSSARTELANAIYRKLQDEHAMQGMGDAQVSRDKQTALVTFAQQIGINDPRLIVK